MFQVERNLASDTDVRRLPAGPPAEGPVTETDLAALPAAAQRFLRAAGTAGRPADWSLRARFRGRFRLRPGLPWMRCQAAQYSSRLEVARVFHMRIDAARVIPLIGRDSYLEGRGRMQGRLLGLVPVADGSGPEFDAGELVTYLNDAVLLAPSMLLRLPVTWFAAGDDAFDVTLADGGHRVTARVFLDHQGRPADFSTEDRYYDGPAGPVRTRWTTPVRGWRQAGGRWLPAIGSAVWHLPDGPFSYAEFTFRPGDVAYNLSPLQAAAGFSAGPGQPGTARRAADRARAVRNWGATAAEQAATLPGDELVAGPAEVITRAVTVAAPAAQVWPWLVQIGQGRGGMYSYDWLENLLGLSMHSASEIRGECQQLAVGDRVQLIPPGWLGMKEGFALPVARVDPGRSIVLREQPPEHPWDAVWSFHVIPDGADRCRLLSRSTAVRQHGLASGLAAVMDPVTLIMTRKMLLGIRDRAEQAGRSG